MTDISSNKPYLIRALYEWCTDFGFTPYMAVFVKYKTPKKKKFLKIRAMLKESSIRMRTYFSKFILTVALNCALLA
jgi:hypothetical protein